MKLVETYLFEKAQAFHSVHLNTVARWRRLSRGLTRSLFFEDDKVMDTRKEWHPGWRWLDENDQFELTTCEIPPMPGGGSKDSEELGGAADSTDPFTMPPPPLDGDRALTGTCSETDPPASSEVGADSSNLLETLKRLPFYTNQIAHLEESPPKEGSYVDFKDFVLQAGGMPLLSQTVVEALQAQGVTRLFKHQSVAIEAALSDSRQHVALSTGTSSGKSVCFNAPVLETLNADPYALAMYLYPTKALAQDQYGALLALLGTEGGPLRQHVQPAVVDGDATFAERARARESANIILSNPDMLHASILPQHTQWRRFLRGLRFIVIDEAHVYRGIFGAHVAMVLKRLVRLCRHYGNSGLQFIYCSATIANPQHHFKQLIPLHALGGDARLTLITEDGAPTGKKVFAIWNPPLVSDYFGSQPELELGLEETSDDLYRGKRKRNHHPPPADYDSQSAPSAVESSSKGTRVSTIVETSRVFTSLIKRGARTLCFAKTRKLTELVLRYSLQDMHATAPHLAQLVRGYRGGYTKEDRRGIERDLFSRKLLGVTCTNALELGVDIGSLDATVHVGFPGSSSSLKQQAGRAGRGGRDGLAVMICFESPLDQLFARDPRALLDMPPEVAVIPVDNHIVLAAQLLCAAKELPLQFMRPVVDDSSRTVSPGDHHSNLKACVEAAAASAQLLEGNLDDDGFLVGHAASIETSKYLLSDGKLTAANTLASTADGAKHFHVTTLSCARFIEAPASCASANIRNCDPATIMVVDKTQDGPDGGRVIDSIGYSRAFYELFEGAIYLHQGRQFLVGKLDLESFMAFVEPVRVNYYTSSRNHQDVDVTKVLESGTGSASIVNTGCVNVVSSVWGWRKHWAGGKVAEMGTFSLPPLEFSTRAFWIDVPPEIQIEVNSAFPTSDAKGGSALENDCECIGHGLQAAASQDVHHINDDQSEASSCDLPREGISRFIESLHGLNHVLAAIAPIFILCEPEDIGTEHVYGFQKRPKPPRVILFDKRPGGTGVTEALFTRGPAVLSKALEVLESCPCSHGCLGCILDGRCPNNHLHKAATTLLARRILAHVLGPSPSPLVSAADDVDRKATQDHPCPSMETTAAALEASPRKRARLRIARGMDEARARGARVRLPWTNTLVPDYQPPGE